MSDFQLKRFVASRISSAVKANIVEAFVDCGFDSADALRYADSIVEAKVGESWFETLALKLIKEEAAQHIVEEEK